MIAASRDQTDGIIISSTLENGGGKTMTLVGLAVQHWEGNVCQDPVQNIGRGVGGDGAVYGENRHHHHLYHPQKQGR